MAQKEIRDAPTSPYRHDQESVLRPDVGVEAQFAHKKPPRNYRYDSSLAPELCWDEDADRALAEWLLEIIAEAAEKGESKVFVKPQVWQGTEESFTSLSQCAARLRSLTKPFLNWSGKAERQQVTVPTLPLFVHERHSSQAILETLQSHKARGTTIDLFGDVDLDIADKLDAYEHKGPWSNRLVLGDSLQVMNSFLEYEGMGGQVQMIYFDPPYGVKFGSNFQPFVRRRDVSHGKDDEMVREPEMVRAYRDTWELGLHSYLSYLRDRLLLAKELLNESGSIFLQISDHNLSRAREVLGEVFGAENFVTTIVFQKTSSESTNTLPNTADYLLWACKDITRIKYYPLFTAKKPGGKGAKQYVHVRSSDYSRVRKMTKEELRDPSSIPEDWKICRRGYPLTSQHYSETRTVHFEFEGKNYWPGDNRQWSLDPNFGMKSLVKRGMIYSTGKSLNAIMDLDNVPGSERDNIWTDTGTGSFTETQLYVVQTPEKVLHRCLLMTTDPGDLVFDPTCGGGTTPVSAEYWGRRWIAADTSRVPLALTRQRLLTSAFPWFLLNEAEKGPAGGLIYRDQKESKNRSTDGYGIAYQHTLSTLAGEEDPRPISFRENPERAYSVTRVAGPFTVEATFQSAASMEEDHFGPPTSRQSSSPRAYLDRMIEVLRQSKTLRLPGIVTMELESVRPVNDREYIHAEGIAKNGGDNAIAIVFGPEDGAIGSEYIFNASMEAMQQGFQQLFLFGFAIQAKAREMLGKLKIPTTYISVTLDVIMSDLLKTSKTSQIFSITGLPDVSLEPTGTSDRGRPLYCVTIKGLDIFRPDTMETDEISAENLPCWMLDTDYNDMAFYASQVFFPKTSAWNNLQRSLKGHFADSVWEHLAGTVSEPFALGDKKRIAVKVIDERGNELMVVKAAGVSA